MNDFLFARSQMAISLAFHIVFAAAGIAMPLLMTIAEGAYLRTKQKVYLDLCKRWSKGTAILFAVGAVSGTVLSFELGLLWPRFMDYAGGIIGMPFSLEGFAFFTEAIFLGIYLYGWNRVPPVAHWISGGIVACSGMLSGVFVVTANAWMNAPTGFEVIDSRVINVDPVAAMLNPASLQQIVHMTIAAYLATALAVSAVHAFYLLRNPQSEFHRCALSLSLAVVVIAAPLQILSGDLIGRMVAERQPVKFAAMEAHYRTAAEAPVIIGGIADDENSTIRYGLRIPRLLSALAHGDSRAKVAGLDQFPRDQWPNTRLVHWAFDVMVAAGLGMLIVAGWAGFAWVRRHSLPDSQSLLHAVVAAGPLGFIAIEAGWLVTELGRQPWIIYGVMRTEDAVTPIKGLIVPFLLFTGIYLFLSVVLAYLLHRQFLETSPKPAGPIQHETYAR